MFNLNTQEQGTKKRIKNNISPFYHQNNNTDQHQSNKNSSNNFIHKYIITTTCTTTTHSIITRIKIISMLKREIFHSKRNYQNPNSIPLNDDTILGIFFIDG